MQKRVEQSPVYFYPYSFRSCHIAFQSGVIHKPRGQLRGEGDSQMTIFLHKPYLVKVTMKGEGGKNTQKFDHVVYGWPLIIFEEIILKVFFQNMPKWHFIQNHFLNPSSVLWPCGDKSLWVFYIASCQIWWFFKNRMVVLWISLYPF